MNLKKTVLITGATGFLGYHLINEYIKRGNTKVIAILGRSEDKVNLLPKNPNLSILPLATLYNYDFGHVDTLIHTAFTRGDNLPGLTQSIDLTERLIEKVNSQDVDSIINISSQGIYKCMKPGEKVDESGDIEPNTTYGLAKWAVENMLRIGCNKTYTNIRMASLSSNARFLDFFVNCVISGKAITVTAPHQYASIMDVEDAVSGILSVEQIEICNRSTTYNLGSGKQYSILDYAETVNTIGQRFDYPSVGIKVEDNGNEYAICMNCDKIQKASGWKPLISKDIMIENMFIKKKTIAKNNVM